MKIYIIILMLVSLTCSSCYKDFLDVKRDKKQVVPSTITDFQAILDNSTTMNSRSAHQFALIGSDDYFVLDESWNKLSNPLKKNGYTWEKEIYEGQDSQDWNFGYKRILYANIVLDGIDKIEPTDQNLVEWSKVKGSALFYRGTAFFYLAQLFANQYDRTTAKTDLGIPLRLEPDVNLKTSRASVEETYAQIIQDIVNALELLPRTTTIKQQPSKQAAMAMLSRVYLQMGDYESAKVWADETLKIGNVLLDYNTLNLNSTYPFPTQGKGNDEIIFLDYTGEIVNETEFNVDSNLYLAYDDNDIRKSAFWESNFLGQWYFKGSYYGNATLFTGLATNEIYLIRAECNGRLGNIKEAVDDINKLLSFRFKEETYMPMDYNIMKGDLLKIVLRERKKELVCRGLRWSDLRRLNKEPIYETNLVRYLNNQKYELKANDVRFTWPIPTEAIKLGKLQQNPR